MHPHYLPDHRLCVLPLPLVGEGRGEGGGQPGICYFTCSYSGPCPAPIPAFPQRGKERRPEGGSSTLTLTLSRKREREQEIPPPLGEGEGQPDASHTACLTIPCVHSLSHLWERAGVRVILSLPRWGRVRVGANLAFAAAPAHIQGRARPPSLPSPRGGRREGQREEAVPSP